VVVGADDPDPRVAGRGLALLQEAGIALDRACQSEAEEVHRGFLKRVRTGRPFLTLKLASSLDGKLATATGESRWITGEAARRRVHLMRAQSDAVLIGKGTAQQDSPRLDVRDLGLAERTPVAVVASSAGDLPPGPLAEAAATRPVWVAHGQPALPDATAALGVRELRVDRTDKGLDLTSLMMRLGEEGLTEILCEGGPTLAAGLLEAGLVDELVWMTAGLTLGADGLNGLGPLGYGALSEAPRFTLHQVQVLGPDVLSVWRPATAEPSP
ncbi:MAG: bifunctional diaminohydroxyphosphoribosylaminopyrimidine deaminase/5-amino-6-(5-phosphoribosylamino)uracil reductase RibD, partial [Pseudomonadota bacterium]